LFSNTWTSTTKGCATFALVFFLFGGKAGAKAKASGGLRCACAKAICAWPGGGGGDSGLGRHRWQGFIQPGGKELGCVMAEEETD